MSPIKTPAHPIIIRFTFGAFALSVLTMGCDPADEPIGDEDELLADAEDSEGDEIDALAATVVEDEELPVLENRVIDFDLTAAIGPIGYAWTGFWFSEETPASLCPTNNLVTGVACSGWSCDNVQLECNPRGIQLGSNQWTSWFSEEGTNYRVCEGDQFVAGMACQGWWCDNIALECIKTNGVTPAPHTCTWSGWFSDEDPAFLAPVGTAIKGVQCYGGYCDSKRYYYCPTG